MYNLNSSAGIPSPPLALFVVMLPKDHLTLHSRMSGSRWVITPSWLSGSWRSFLHSYSVYSCHLFLISSASVRPIPFLSFIVPIFAWNEMKRASKRSNSRRDISGRRSSCLRKPYPLTASSVLLYCAHLCMKSSLGTVGKNPLEEME